MPLQNVSSALNVFFYTFESLAINSLPTAISSMLIWAVLALVLCKPAPQFRFVQGSADGGQDGVLMLMGSLTPPGALASPPTQSAQVCLPELARHLGANGR